jgi:hypothetical protein
MLAAAARRSWPGLVLVTGRRGRGAPESFATALIRGGNVAGRADHPGDERQGNQPKDLTSQSFEAVLSGEGNYPPADL